MTSRESLESKRKGHLRGEMTRGPCPRTDGIESPLPGEPNKLQAAGAGVYMPPRRGGCSLSTGQWAGCRRSYATRPGSVRGRGLLSSNPGRLCGTAAGGQGATHSRQGAGRGRSWIQTHPHTWTAVHLPKRMTTRAPPEAVPGPASNPPHTPCVHTHLHAHTYMHTLMCMHTPPHAQEQPSCSGLTAPLCGLEKDLCLLRRQLPSYARALKSESSVAIYLYFIKKD